MFKKLFLIVTLALSATAQARHASVPLKDPPPVSVLQGVAPADVEKAILGSALRRNWKVLERKPGTVVLEYAPREFSVKVQVRYDTRSVNISYLDSSNMEHATDDRGVVIHPNYNRWVNNLAHDIEAEMSQATVK